MSMQDLVSDFVARVNNSVRANNTEVEVIKNKLVVAICKKLVKLGYFHEFKEEDKNCLVVVNTEKYNKMRRVSKPGLRVYASSDEKYSVEGGIGYYLLTTSDKKERIKTHVEAARDRVGGEVILEIY